MKTTLEYPIAHNFKMDAHRLQLPIGSAYSQTVDRSMSQNLSATSVDCRHRPSMSPGYWYTALSRTPTHDTMLLIGDKNEFDAMGGLFLNNTAYREIINRFSQRSDQDFTG